jgi:hypothetical protein
MWEYGIQRKNSGMFNYSNVDGGKNPPWWDETEKTQARGDCEMVSILSPKMAKWNLTTNTEIGGNNMQWKDGQKQTFLKTWDFEAGLHDIYQHGNPLGMSKQECGIYMDIYTGYTGLLDIFNNGVGLIGYRRGRLDIWVSKVSSRRKGTRVLDLLVLYHVPALVWSFGTYSPFPSFSVFFPLTVVCQGP